MVTTCVLHYVFIQTECVGEWKRTLYAVWRVSSNHSTDCYFCMLPPIQNGMSMKTKSTLVYPDIPSAIRPVPHGDGLPVPEPPDDFAIYSDDDDCFLRQRRTAAISFKRCRLLAKHKLLHS